MSIEHMGEAGVAIGILFWAVASITIMYYTIKDVLIPDLRMYFNEWFPLPYTRDE